MPDFFAALRSLGGWNWYIDGWIVAVAALCSVACSLLGCYLVLRKMSMMGDAISHAVLPGLAVAFLVTSSRTSWPMFLGAVVVGVLTAFFTEWLRRRGRVDEGASMGVVFTSLFALGLVLIVQAADAVDIDPGCVLYGLLEFTPLDTVEVGGGRVVPRVALTLGVVLILNALFVLGLYKELKISSFDPALATTLGMNATFMHYALMTLVAVTAVASFEAVGNILVVAVMIVPPATAYLLTHRLSTMLLLSVLIASGGALLGHVAAIAVPAAYGYRSVNTAGAIAAMLGLMFLTAVLAAPRQGVVAKAWHRMALSRRIGREDLLAKMFRREERGEAEPVTARSPWVVGGLVRRGMVERGEGGLTLTEKGRRWARHVVRSHRLWETYLDQHTATPADHLHRSAEVLEHATDADLAEVLAAEAGLPQVDPHGRLIPPEGEPPA